MQFSPSLTNKKQQKVFLLRELFIPIQQILIQHSQTLRYISSLICTMTFNSHSSMNNFLPQQKHHTSLSQLRKTQSILFEDQQNQLVYKNVVLPAQTLNEQICIYEWRNIIEKGIAHCFWTCILPVDKRNVSIQVKYKFYPYTLKDIAKVSLTQLIHILDEILVGLQILYNKFGGFQISDECIFIDQNFQIEVWASKQPASNAFCSKQQNQHQFLSSILQLLSTHQIRSKLTKKFNEGLQMYEQLTFIHLKDYLERFVSENQLAIGSQKSVKQIFLYPKGIKKLMGNHDKNGLKTCSFNFIQASENQRISPKSDLENSQKETSLQFSSSRKIRKKGAHKTGHCCPNVLKDSDMTTEETQNLSGSRDTKNEKENHSLFSMSENKLCFGFQFRSPSKKAITYKQQEQTPNFQELHIPMIQRLQISGAKRQDRLDNYTKKALSERENQAQVLVDYEDKQNDQNNKAAENVYAENFCVESQDQRQSRPQIDLMLFRQKLKPNCHFFNTIDSLADTKKMTDSIQVEEEKLKKSPVKLQKLSNIKTKLYESIMEEDFFAETVYLSCPTQQQIQISYCEPAHYIQ